MFGGAFNPFSVGAEVGGGGALSEDESVAGSDAETVIEKPKLDAATGRKLIVKKPDKLRHPFRVSDSFQLVEPHRKVKVFAFFNNIEI
jgi:hypothetical protein